MWGLDSTGNKRLGIVIPYRDREEHLSAFLPHMHAYFARDKADKHIPVRILVVEQPPGLPFNRGLLRNIGYQILRNEIDYVCFHDVDYLPMWADYSYPARPSMLIGYGLAPKPIQQIFIEQPRKYFGGVVLLQNEHVERANGYSNEYWGWGQEDEDLQRRLDAVDLERDYRWGTFAALDHDRSDGNSFDTAGNLVRSPVSQRNWDRLLERWNGHPHWRDDGVNSLRFTPIERKSVKIGGRPERDITTERVTVDFPHRP